MTLRPDNLSSHIYFLPATLQTIAHHGSGDQISMNCVFVDLFLDLLIDYFPRGYTLGLRLAMIALLRQFLVVALVVHVQ